MAYIKSLQGIDKLACVVFTTELDNPFQHILLSNKLINSYKADKSLYLCIEDLGFMQDDQINQLINIKPFYCSLTWNHRNKFASGCLAGGGLTDKGKKLISMLEKNGVLVDLAHLNKQSFYDVAKVTNIPLFCSHTACSAVLNNKRNLQDMQIKTIVESGGLIGVFFVGKFITTSKNFTSYDIAKHFAHIAEKFGTKNISVGSDFYGTDDLPSDINSYNDFDNLKTSLQNIGFVSSELDDIFCHNFSHFVKNISNNNNKH